jgi:predicted DNA-binding transcriptional regulator YafY
MKSDQGYSIPLKPYRDGQKVYMRYEDTNFSIYNQKLTDIEKRIILNATDVISRASGLQPFEDFQDILPKLKDAIDIKTTSQISISFEANLDLKGKEYFKIISEAINKKQILDINYKDFKSEEPYKLIFHPYYLKQYNDRWFAFGLNEATQISTWNVPLDRIEKIEYVNTKYIPSDTDWYEYFYDIVGVTRLNKKVEEVVLKFTKEQAPYIETKPLHPTQKLDWVGDSLIAKIEVIPNYELETLILSFGEKVEVLESEDLRKKIKVRLNLTTENYRF